MKIVLSIQVSFLSLGDHSISAYVSVEALTAIKSISDFLVTLLRLFRSETDNHFYTNSETEAQNSVTSLNYVREQSPGRIVLSASDCSCGKNFIAIHRLYKIDRNGSKEDHLYTNSTQESYNAVNGLGYIRESVGFYCSPNQFYCGATIPLYRYYRGFDHFYTTDLDEGNESIKSTGGKYEGILCYIWPSDVTPVMVPQPAKSCPLNSGNFSEVFLDDNSLITFVFQYHCYDCIASKAAIISTQIQNSKLRML